MNLAKYIDHTLLRADATEAEISRLCHEAVTQGFHSVCVNGSWVAPAVQILKGSAVNVATVVGFPLGASATEVKVFETRTAVGDGAAEVDAVIALGRLKGGEDEYVRIELQEIVQAAEGRVVKAILETGSLTDAEIVRACRLAVEAGCHFVKTSTGFGPGGATVEHVRLMKSTVGDHFQVKASGGIRTRVQALALIEAGATRLGTSAGVAIVAGEDAEDGY